MRSICWWRRLMGMGIWFGSFDNARYEHPACSLLTECCLIDENYALGADGDELWSRDRIAQ